MHKLLLKFWRYRLELKLSKIIDKDKVELLSNKLIKELNINIDPECELITIAVFNKKELTIDSSKDKELYMFKGKYTGR